MSPESIPDFIISYQSAPNEIKPSREAVLAILLVLEIRVGISCFLQAFTLLPMAAQPVPRMSIEWHSKFVIAWKVCHYKLIHNFLALRRSLAHYLGPGGTGGWEVRTA
jgi:hypothetical protein